MTNVKRTYVHFSILGNRNKLWSPLNAERIKIIVSQRLAIVCGVRIENFFSPRLEFNLFGYNYTTDER